MLSQRNSYLSVVLVLLSLAFFPLAKPTSFAIDQTRDPIFDQIPMKIGDWKGKDIKLEERTYEILETRNVLSRAYINSKGESIDLLLVASHRDRRVAHPPEVCYVGANFSITNEQSAKIKTANRTIPVKEFAAQDKKHPAYQENVLYVYKAGDFVTTNYYAQQLHFVLKQLRKQEPRILLIRLSSVAHHSDLEQFLTQVFPYLS